MKDLQIQYRVTSIMDYLVKAMRRMAHTVIPKGSSPVIYRRLILSLYKLLVYDSEAQVVTVKKGILAGMKKYGPFAAGDFDFALGQYEPEVMTALCEFCRPGMTVFDIGANAGSITMLLAKLVGDSGHVHAFEPIPQNVRCLLTTLRINALNNVTVHEMAVSNQPGKVLMQFDGVFDGFASLMHGGHGYYQNKPANTISVTAVTLDQFCMDVGVIKIDLIKMDIEGAEMLALAGMHQVLTTYRPALIIEFWGSRHCVEGPDFLRSLGYEISILSAWSGFVCGAHAEIQNILAMPNRIG